MTLLQIRAEEGVEQEANGEDSSADDAHKDRDQRKGQNLAQDDDFGQAIALKPVRKRESADGMRCDWQVSIRRACSGLGFDPKSYRYKPRAPISLPFKSASRRFTRLRVRYGYGRVHVTLQREGWGISHKKTRRIYNELGLQLRNKTPKRRVKAKLREDPKTASEPHETWAMDFVHDQLAAGRKLRNLTVVDRFSRYSAVLDARFTCRGEDVVATLERVCQGDRLSEDDPCRSSEPSSVQRKTTLFALSIIAWTQTSRPNHG